MTLRRIIASAVALAATGLTLHAGVVLKDTLLLGAQYAASPAELLAGRISGVRVSDTNGDPVGGLTNVNIRGIGNIRTDCQPLYVIDGIILGQGLNLNRDNFWQLGEQGYASAVNPLAFLPIWQIESIEVLKNATETAPYGALGANGVIIIKTKRNTADDWSLDWESNAGVALSSGQGVNPNANIIHSHGLALSGITGKTGYYVTGQFRSLQGPAPKTPQNYLTATAGIKADAGDFMNFSTGVIFSRGTGVSQSSTANLGHSSYATAVRGITDVDTAEGWLADFDDLSEETRLATSASASVRFFTGFYWRTSIGVDYQAFNRFFWYGDGTAFGAAGNGQLAVSGNKIFRDNAATSLEYGRYFGKHRFDLSVKGEQIYFVREYNTMPGNDFFSHILRGKGLNLSGYSAGLSHHFNLPLKQFAASASLSYNYAKKLGADLYLKAQYTDKYLDAPVYYPAAEVYADLRSMLLKESAAVSTLRLEGGWGISGYEHLDPVLSDQFIEDNTEQFFKGFTDIRTSEWHATLRTGLFGERLKAAFTYYDRSTDDKYTMYCFGSNQHNPYKIGGEFLWNWDKKTVFREYSSGISNRGYEIDVEAVPVKGPQLKWTVGANFAYNASRMTSVNRRDSFGEEILPSQGLFANANVPGYQPWAIYGIDESTGYETVIGNPFPKYIGGLHSELSCGRLTVEVVFDAAADYDILNLNDLVLDQKDAERFVISSKYIEDGTYLRLKRLGMSYDVPLGLKWVKSFCVRLGATNLFTLGSYSGFNPSVGSYAAPMASGLDYGTMPVLRNIVLGVSVKF